MNRLHARYPFLTTAREAVRDAEVGLADIVTSGGSGDRHPAVERGVERVRRALLHGTVERESGRWNARTELLSYPIARVLVSLLDAPGAVEKYARAEADTAAEQFTDDFTNADDGLRSTRQATLTRDALLADFELRGDVTERDDGFGVAVGTYLSLSSEPDDEAWRLVNRKLADGMVFVTEAELHTLLREAVRERVAADLPIDVPEPLAAGLTEEVAELQDVFADIDLSHDIDTLAPDLFPPCMKALLEAVRSDDTLPPHSMLSLVTFLTSIGMVADEIIALCNVSSSATIEAIRYRVERVRDERGPQYAPPSCETMQAYGDCVNADARCERIAHPLEYYEAALADADDTTDWRERTADA